MFMHREIIKLIMRFPCFLSLSLCRVAVCDKTRATHFTRFQLHFVECFVAHALVLLELKRVVRLAERVPRLNRDCNLFERRAEVVLVGFVEVSKRLPGRTLQVFEQEVAVLVGSSA